MFLFKLEFSSIYWSREDEDEKEKVPHYIHTAYNPYLQLFVADERVWRDEGDKIT